MKKVFVYILTLCFIIPIAGCTDKKAELHKEYDNVSYEIQQTQQQIDDLQDKMDLAKAAMDDADKSGAASDTEYGKVLMEQSGETYNEAIAQMSELKKQLETHQLYQESIKEQLDKLK